MAGDVLCGGVHDNVCAEGERLLVDRRGKCAVNAHESTLQVAQLGDEFNVDALEVGVRGRVGIEECDLRIYVATHVRNDASMVRMYIIVMF
jgi:hypothetical protein